PSGIRVRLAAVVTWVACAAGVVAAVSVLQSGHSLVLRTSQILPLTGVTLVLGPLGAVFVIATAAVAVAATIFWIGYASHGLSTRTASAVPPAFIVAMLLG